MRPWVAPALLVMLLLLTGCTDMQAAETSEAITDSASSPPASAAPSAESSPGERDIAQASETPSAKASPDPRASNTDEDTTAAKARRMELVTVDEDDEGEDVEALQERLDELGFAPGPIDGAYGPRTVAAVEAFQMLSGLRQTGRADARTIAELATFQSAVRPVEAGDSGNAVKRLQRRLANGPFDPGGIDGEYGGYTVQAVWALEKLAGIPVDGNWGPLDEYAFERLTDGKIGAPSEDHDQRWVEVDLSQQLMKVYEPGDSTPFLVSHASTGNGQAWSNGEHSGTSITPQGDFEISRRISGWRESSLDIGRLYNPLYFNGGIALHGALSVPLYPASHGCVRLPMHIAEYLPGELPNGTPVHVTG